MYVVILNLPGEDPPVVDVYGPYVTAAEAHQESLVVAKALFSEDFNEKEGSFIDEGSDLNFIAIYESEDVCEIWWDIKELKVAGLICSVVGYLP